MLLLAVETPKLWNFSKMKESKDYLLPLDCLVSSLL